MASLIGHLMRRAGRSAQARGRAAHASATRLRVSSARGSSGRSMIGHVNNPRGINQYTSNSGGANSLLARKHVAREAERTIKYQTRLVQLQRIGNQANRIVLQSPRNRRDRPEDIRAVARFASAEARTLTVNAAVLREAVRRRNRAYRGSRTN